MVFSRPILALALLGGCAASRTSPPPVAPSDPVADAPVAPSGPVAEAPPANASDIAAVRLTVAYPDVRKLANTLRNILEVRPDRGDVRAILDNEHESTLLVFATPAGHAAVRRLLAGLVPAAS